MLHKFGAEEIWRVKPHVWAYLGDEKSQCWDLLPEYIWVLGSIWDVPGTLAEIWDMGSAIHHLVGLCTVLKICFGVLGDLAHWGLASGDV